jgi:hypothetical protein
MKKLLPVFFTVILILFISACGTTDKDEGSGTNNGTNSDKTAVEETETSESSEQGTSDTSKDANGTEESTDANEENVIKTEATYVGMQDPHTIEVKTESATISLQTTGGPDVNFEEIEENTKVTIEYYKNEQGQNMLTSFTVNE